MRRKLALVMAACIAVVSAAVNVPAASTISVNRVSTVRDEAELTDTYLKIIPRDTISTGDTIILKFNNAKVLTNLPDFGSLQGNGRSWSSLESELYEKGARETLLDLWETTSDNYIPWKYRRLGNRELEVSLFPIPSDLCDSNIYGRKTKPNYYLPLCVMADTNGKAADISVSIDANGTAIGGGGTIYDFANAPLGSSSVSGSNKTETSSESTSETTTEEETEALTEETTHSEPYEIRVSIGSVKAVSDGKDYTLDVAPYIQESSSSTMVPLRFVTVAAGGENAADADNSDIVEWNAVTKTAVIKLDNKTISFTAGSGKININGTESVMENGVCAEIKNGRMFIPFRALGNAIGVDVDWEASTKTAVFKIN